MHTKLLVLIRPYFIESLKDSQCQEFIEEYSIEYKSKSYPEATIQWMRNNELITSISKEFRIEKKSFNYIGNKIKTYRYIYS